MKWAWKLGRYAGIDVYIHATFLLLIGWIVLSHLMGGRGPDAAVEGVVFTLLLFACVRRIRNRSCGWRAPDQP
jgi:Zn-dependent protease